MKIIIFAGGVGTRLWPLSRKNSPKQFGKIIGEKSTLQQTVERLSKNFTPYDIFVATGKRYESIVREQLSQIPQDNFIFEPDMRDVGPAIGLAATIIGKKFPNEPVAILWSDHLVKNTTAFLHALSLAENTIKTKQSDFVFIAQKPRFANQNMGWIETGDEVASENGVRMYNFKRLIYRPKPQDAQMFFTNQNYCWNLGYFVTTPEFLLSLYKSFAPQMYSELEILGNAAGTNEFEEKLQDMYPKLEKVSFDDLILIKMNPDKILVISTDLEWSDVGAWESLKEALSDIPEQNVTAGKVLLEDSKDSLVYSFTDQLCVGIDLDGFLVINTEDVLLVCPKNSVPKIKKLVENLRGTQHEHLA